MMKWFHNLKVAQKLALISFVFVLPDSIMLYLFITSINETINFARLEQVGNEYQRPLERLLELAPRQRLEARRAPDRDRLARLRRTAAELDDAFDAVERVDHRIGKELGFTPEGLAKRQRQGCDVAGVRAEWRELKAQTLGGAPPTEERDQRYLTLIEHIRGMIAHAGDMSNLILDPDLDTYYLMDATLLALPQTQDRLSRVMGDGEDFFSARGDAVARARVTLATDLAFLKTDDLDRNCASIETALTSGNPLYGAHLSFHKREPGVLKAYAAAAARFNDLTDRIQRGDGGVSLAEYLGAGDAARAASFKLWQVSDEELNGMLQGRIDYYVHRRMRSLGVAACALLAAMGLVTFITKSISGPLKKQAFQLKAINGELSEARALLEDRVEQTRAALDRTEQKYRKIFENAVMGIFQISPDGHFRSANTALATIFGYDSPERLLLNDAQTNRRLYADDDTRALFAHLMNERGFVTDFQSEIRYIDGSARWVSENAREVRDDKGELLYYEGTMEDITQRKRAQAEEQRSRLNSELALAAAEEARAAAEAASTAKSDFLATMSHEIRTPLNGVIGMADLLAHTTLSAQQARYVKIIHSSSDGLLSIINQILDFSKIEAGKLELCEREFDLPTAVEEVVVVLAQKAAAKGLELACQIDPSVAVRVRGDDDRLRQVLMNIVNNGIKFTERGEVIVRVSAAPRKDASNPTPIVRFAVTDTGTGIPSDRMDRLFKSFSQIDSSVTRQYGGTGLGLAISKQLVELMGGEIGAESTPGKGSIFWFTVPLEPLAAAPGDAPGEMESFSLAGHRMLIVDDSPMQCQVLQEQLRAWGVETVCAASAEAGLPILQAGASDGRPFEVAIVDLNMPGIGGLAMAQTIRATERLRDLPLILMSGMEGISAVEERDLGQFLTKPIRQSSLLDAVMKARMRPRPPVVGTAVNAPAIAIESTPNPAPGMARPIRILLAEDVEVNQFVVTETLTRAGYSCKIANNGREAVAAATSEMFDVILMDCQMPEMSGFEATAAIRAFEQAGGAGGKRARIVALTANAVKGDRERCLAAGMDDYLTKPLNPARLLQCLGAHDGALTAPQLAPATAPPKAPEVIDAGAVPRNDGSVNFAELLARCDGDQAMMARLVQLFENKSRQTWDGLLASYRSGDAAGTARLAHALKGSAANLSAVKVCGLAARLEELGRSSDLSAAESVVRQLEVELNRCREALSTWSGPETVLETQSTSSAKSDVAV
ncbi:MAG TPA: response regulator [Tepidisphaeraceae bacterium]|jgi:PAS domain S-box-containing protein|nr:response regulator [Tepidisphaeraceae bacterium]